MSGIIHKVKDALHHGSHSTTTSGHQTGVHEGTTGPHSSAVANVADSRVGSDLDGSNKYARTTGTSHTGSTGA
ncbi:hypothetical protein V501_01550, partial [Pseudogymnoascus sp. VKM F-4519 (FW-2642)]